MDPPTIEKWRQALFVSASELIRLGLKEQDWLATNLRPTLYESDWRLEAPEKSGWTTEPDNALVGLEGLIHEFEWDRCSLEGPLGPVRFGAPEPAFPRKVVPVDRTRALFFLENKLALATAGSMEIQEIRPWRTGETGWRIVSVALVDTRSVALVAYQHDKAFLLVHDFKDRKTLWRRRLVYTGCHTLAASGSTVAVMIRIEEPSTGGANSWPLMFFNVANGNFCGLDVNYGAPMDLKTRTSKGLAPFGIRAHPRVIAMALLDKDHAALLFEDKIELRWKWHDSGLDPMTILLPTKATTTSGLVFDPAKRTLSYADVTGRVYSLTIRKNI